MSSFGMGFPPSFVTGEPSLKGSNAIPLSCLKAAFSQASSFYCITLFVSPFRLAVDRGYFYSFFLSSSVSLFLFLSLASSFRLVLLREHNTALFVTPQSFPWQPTRGPGASLCLRSGMVQEKVLC